MSAVPGRIVPCLPRGVTFTRDQMRALYGILDDIQYRRHRGAVLKGYAGCGKTWLAAYIVEELESHGYRVALAAPTNKAAGVLQQSFAKMRYATAVLTVHALLKLRPVRHLDGNLEFVQGDASHLDAYHVIVIDECSMISHRMFSLLLRCKAYLLFLGDPAQLPPVGYQDISPTFSHPDLAQFELRTVVRQKGESSILTLAQDVRDADAPFANVFPYADGESLHIVRHQDYPLVQVDPDATRMLAWTNKVVDRYNQSIHQFKFPWSGMAYEVGERIVLQAAYFTGCLGFSNGTEATVQSVESGVHPDWPQIPAWKLRVILSHGLRYPSPEEAACAMTENTQKPVPVSDVEATLYVAQSLDQLIRLEEYHFREARSAQSRNQLREAENWSAQGWKLRDDFARVRHAYASTVHKSQGSTYHTAVVDLHDLQNPKARGIFNRLLYTAITRPSHRLVLLS